MSTSSNTSTTTTASPSNKQSGDADQKTASPVPAVPAQSPKPAQQSQNKGIPPEKKAHDTVMRGVGQFLMMNQDKLQEERDREKRERPNEQKDEIPGFGGVSDAENRYRDRSTERDRPDAGQDNSWRQQGDELMV